MNLFVKKQLSFFTLQRLEKSGNLCSRVERTWRTITLTLQIWLKKYLGCWADNFDCVSLNFLEVNNKTQIKVFILPQDWCLQIAVYQVTSTPALPHHTADSARCSVDGWEQPLEAQLMRVIKERFISPSLNSKGDFPHVILKVFTLNILTKFD